MLIVARMLIMIAGLLAVAPPVFGQNFLLLASPTQELSDGQRAILTKVSRHGETVSEDLHRQFWSMFSDTDREIWIEAERSGTPKSDDILARNSLEWAYWSSRYESQRTGKVMKAAELEPLRAKVLSLMRSDAERKRWMEEFQRQDKQFEPGWISPPKSTWRHPLRLFAEANDARARLQQSQMLLNSEWNDTPRIWPYPPMHLNLMWPYPWQMLQAVLCEADCKYWEMTQAIGVNGRIGVFFYSETRPDWNFLESKNVRTGMNLMTDL